MNGEGRQAAIIRESGLRWLSFRRMDPSASVAASLKTDVRGKRRAKSRDLNLRRSPPENQLIVGGNYAAQRTGAATSLTTSYARIADNLTGGSSEARTKTVRNISKCFDLLCFEFLHPCICDAWTALSTSFTACDAPIDRTASAIGRQMGARMRHAAARRQALRRPDRRVGGRHWASRPTSRG